MRVHPVENMQVTFFNSWPPNAFALKDIKAAIGFQPT